METLKIIKERMINFQKTIFAAIFIVVISVLAGYLAVSKWNKSDKEEIIEIEVPEGLRKEQTVFLLAEKLNWSDDQIEKFVEQDTPIQLNMQEGYSAPGIYQIPAGASSWQAAEIMRQAALKLYEPFISRLPAADWDKVLIVASIIQREMIGREEDRFKIAERIWNALDNCVPIKSDAVAAYSRDTKNIFGESWCGEADPKTDARFANGPPECWQDWRFQFHVGEAGNYKWWLPASDNDRADDWEDFNVYGKAGLPPRPICNPGIVAVEAAIMAKFPLQ